MPEAVTPSSEKLVPIDTSGNAVDVTLKEDKKDDVVATTEGDAPVVEVKEDFEGMVSLKTFVDKEDIANMALFLLSDQAHRISGQVMTVDGNTERMD